MIRLTDVRTTMMSNGTAQSRQSLKTEAKTWRGQRQMLGMYVTHGEALETVARLHGFRDWNTACGLLPESDPAPFAPGGRVAGTYLKQPFEGTILSTRPLSPGHTSVTILFDVPVNVTPSSPYSHIRRRVTVTLDEEGMSPSRTSDGQPHMCLT
jgi:hypothetical protein